MSKTIDEKVVEMSFDNRNFEKNVKESLSTIDKLKAKLNFSGMSKGLDQLADSANKVNFNGITQGIETVGLQFNSLYSIADQAMRRITDSVMNFGLNIGKQLIIDPKKLGFNEYELKMQSVQTIMAGSKESLEEVNKQLEELNKYSDQTIYSFQDMTANIGKFTNMGVKLEDAVAAIKGVSNEAALSGANATEASRAMYNFAQALSAGYVKLIDWKSIENANMATKDFKDELIKTAVAMGTLKEANDGMYETLGGETLNSVTNFNDSLKDQWMTSEVLITTLKKYSDETTDIGQRAKAAAQDVKTFSMLLDTLTEAVQSGWAQSFEIIFGDFNEAKKLWTKVSNAIGKVIENVSTLRNKYLQSFLGRSFTKTYENMVKAFNSIKESTNGLKEAVKTVSDYANLVDEIINGIWGNGQARWDALSEAGYDWAHAQNLVNERLGFSLRRQTDYVEVTDEVAKSTEKINEATEDYISNLANAYKKEQNKQKLNDEELQYLEAYHNLSKEQQEAIKQVIKLSDKLAMPVKELLKNMDNINGRWLLFESFGNIGKTIITIFEAIGRAWVEVFPPEEAGKTLFNITTAFYKLTRVIKDWLGEINNNDGAVSNAEHLVSIFKGLFSILGVITDFIKGTLSIVLTGLGRLFGMVLGPGESFLSLLDMWSEKLYKFNTGIREWLQKNLKFSKVFEVVTKTMSIFISKAKNFIKTNTTMQKILEMIKTLLSEITNKIKNLVSQILGADGKLSGIFDRLFEKLGDWLNNLKNADNIPLYIINGLINGLTKSTTKLFNLIMSIGQNIIDIFCKVLKIHSPSKVFYNIGQFIMKGLIGGIKSGLNPFTKLGGQIASNILATGNNIKDVLVTSFKNVASMFGGIDYKKLLAVTLTGGLLYITKMLNDTVLKITDAFASVTAPLKAFAGLMTKVGNSIDVFLTDLAKTQRIKAIGGVIKGVALSLLMVAASMYIIAKIDPDRLLSAYFVCSTMLIILGALYLVIDKLATGGGGLNGGIDVKAKKATFNVGPLIGLSLALLAMSIALKKLSVIDTYALTNAIKGMVTVVTTMIVLVASIGVLTKIMKISGDQLSDATKSIKKIATSMLLMLLVIKLASKIKPEEVKQSIWSIGLIAGIFTAFVAISQFSGEHAAKAAVLMGVLSISLLAMLGVIKIASMLKPKDVAKGLAAVYGITGMFGALIVLSQFSGKNALKAAALIAAFSMSILGIIAAVKLLSTMSAGDLLKGTVAIGAISVLIAGLIAISHYSGANAAKAGVMLLSVSASLAILAGVIFLLSTMDAKSLTKGVGVISIISLLFMGLIKSTEKSKEASKIIIGLMASMSVLLGFVIALSFIDTRSLLAATSTISAIMLSLAVLMKSVDKMDKKSILSLLAVSTILLSTLSIMTLIIKSLSKLDPENSLAAASSLSMLLTTMTGVLSALTLVSKFGSKNTAVGIGLLTILASTVVPILALIITGLSKINPNKSILIMKTLSLMLIEMTGALAALTLIGLGGPAALIGIGSLTVLIAAFAGILTLFGTVNKKLPNAAKFLDTGIPLLITIGNAIGSFFGSIVKGFGNQVLTLLPELGTSLSGFMKNLETFLSGTKSIPKDLSSKIASLSAGIVFLAGAEFISKLASITSGDISIDKLGIKLSNFMDNLQPFIESVSKIPPEITKSTKNLADAILSITTSNLLNSIPLIGNKSFDGFGEGLSALGTGLSDFNDKIKGIKDIKNIETASKSLKILADSASEIPNQGGLISIFIGDNTLKKFSSGMKKLATGLVEFSSELTNGSFDDNSLKSVKAACKAITEIAKTAQEIPNAGGLLATIVGENDMKTFGSGMNKLATGLSGFISVLVKNNFTEDSIPLVASACEAIKKLSTLSKEIPNAGGLLAKLVGDNDLSTFASSLPELGVGIAGFITSISEDDVTDNKLDNLGNMISSISNLMKQIKNSNYKDTMTINSYFNTMGNSIKGFINVLSKTTEQDIIAALNKIGYIISFTQDFSRLNIENISNLSSSLKDLADKSIKNFVKAFEKQDYRITLKNSASALGAAAFEGIHSKVTKAKGYDVGKYFVEGFANGIKDNQYLATNASSDLGRAALKAAKKSLKEKSPSKATYEIGKFFDLGMVNGIKDYASNVYSVSKEVGDTAKFGISNAISKITDIISSESDTQPTITPVLDLSNVESGAGQINSMFANTRVGIGANINAISAGIRMRNQNAVTNGDVVSAIDKLKDSIIDKQPGNTYNLNGITYNDDTPIANAVSDLINAIEIEGRV